MRAGFALPVLAVAVALSCACIGDYGRIWSSNQCVKQVCGEDHDASTYPQCEANCRSAYGR